MALEEKRLKENLASLSRRYLIFAVITGFNTDIEFQGVTYHVQTEDKGLETPLILSLVYDRGTILASKRSPYNDLLESDFNEIELAERLQRQHKLICAAVRAGRIDDLKKMTQKESAAKRKDSAAKRETSSNSENKTDSDIHISDIPLPQLLNTLTHQAENGARAGGISANSDSALNVTDDGVLEIPISVLENLIVEEVEIVEEEMILPAEAVEVVSEPPKIEEPVDNSLKIEVLNELSFKGGERKTLSIQVRRGASKDGLSGAHVMVKILGSSFRPLIFHAKTDSNGVAIVHLQLPSFTRGRAAVLIRAMSGGEEVELRRSISQD